ncbi:MAG TPA: FAD-dependent monooxygenase [Ktedonobacteraceae bacterium]|nr:FAD-dependent monooxygenase [Ktedonobacteraceae bacterium]
MEKQISPVLIVGAGPTGLTFALQLVRYGIPFHIIDKHAAPLELSKAAAIHARTLEIFADLDVIDDVLTAGQRVDILDLRTRYADRMRLDFSRLKHTAYPFMLDLPQYRTEAILRQKLEQLGYQIERGVQLVDLHQEQDYVDVRLRHVDGPEEHRQVSWLIGADGAKSTVRTLAGLDFPGEAYADDWVLVDAKLKWPLPRNEMTFSSDPDGIYGVFPLPGENRYRVAYTQSRDAAGHLIEPDLEDVQRSIHRTGIAGQVLQVDQFSTFNLAHRHVEQSQKGRIFLAGDAAHVHTPFGGQGMNLGIGDAYNLGWKLASVLRGEAPESVLASYQHERAAVVKNVIRTTHLGVLAMLIKTGRQAQLRDGLMQALGSSAFVPRTLTYAFSQLAHHYRHSPLSQGRALRLQAGDRAPNQAFFDGITQSYMNLYDVLQGTTYSLLLFVGEKEQQILALKPLLQAVTSQVPGQIAVSIVSTAYQRLAELPPSVGFLSDRSKDLSLYHQFGATVAYLIRPDKYIGYIQVNPTWEHLERYLQRVILGRPLALASASR